MPPNNDSDPFPRSKTSRHVCVSSEKQKLLLKSWFLQQPKKLLHREIRLANDRAERSAVQLFVIGNNKLAKGLRAPKNHMAAFLSPHYKSRSFQRFNAGSPRDTRQLTHTAINTASKRSSGTASLSSSSAAM